MFSKKLAGFVALAGLFLAGSAFAALDGSAHDFSDQVAGTDAWNTSGEQCKACHTTHNTDTTVAEAPLWNHDLSTATGYQMYVGFDMDAVGTPTSPDGISLLCMGCHDGVVALDSYGGGAGTGDAMGAVNAAANVSKDLRDDHPVSITYNAALVTADGGLELATDAGVVALLASGKVQCSSCHDVHGNANDSLLVMDNAGSALCNTCHNK
jgi:predicted CXXCH cytochrome family protein